MCTLTFKQSYSGTYFLTHREGELPKRLSMTKALGGKGIVTLSRWWTHRGYGAWITDYTIEADKVEKAKKSLESFGITSIWIPRE